MLWIFRLLLLSLLLWVLGVNVTVDSVTAPAHQLPAMRLPPPLSSTLLPFHLLQRPSRASFSNSSPPPPPANHLWLYTYYVLYIGNRKLVSFSLSHCWIPSLRLAAKGVYGIMVGVVLLSNSPYKSLLCGIQCFFWHYLNHCSLSTENRTVKSIFFIFRQFFLQRIQTSSILLVFSSVFPIFLLFFFLFFVSSFLLSVFNAFRGIICLVSSVAYTQCAQQFSFYFLHAADVVPAATIVVTLIAVVVVVVPVVIIGVAAVVVVAAVVSQKLSQHWSAADLIYEVPSTLPLLPVGFSIILSTVLTLCAPVSFPISMPLCLQRPFYSTGRGSGLFVLLWHLIANFTLVLNLLRTWREREMSWEIWDGNGHQSLSVYVSVRLCVCVYVCYSVFVRAFHNCQMHWVQPAQIINCDASFCPHSALH